MAVSAGRFETDVNGRSGRVQLVRPQSQGRLSAYARYLQISDLAVIVASVLLAQTVRFGATRFYPVGQFEVPMAVFIVTVIAAWWLCLRVVQAHDRRILGSGVTEYTRVFRGCFMFFGGLAVVVLLFNLAIARGFLAVAIPLGTLGLLLERRIWRGRLARSRSRGANLHEVLVVGDELSSESLIRRLRRHPELGFNVSGVCLPSSLDTSSPDRAIIVDSVEVPIFGDVEHIRDAVAVAGATVVAVTSAEALGPAAMRELSWQLEGMDIGMMVAPALLDVAGPRLMMSPQAGLPLLHVDKPRYEGATRLLKLVFDKSVALALLVVLSPVLVMCAIAIKFDSKGPVFYRGERIGLGNEAFRMWKFRSMVVDADQQRAQLVSVDEGNGVLFKMREDPRVTQVGRVLRRYSLDELPQLFNVLDGSMSLVGPRPPLREEVETYDHVVVRRMLVRPGMTGLWQVSGRSDLSWEETVQLDLSYVENWSLVGDLAILWRTARAVVSKDGAY
ncbi:sugar transferase [Gordonia sp. NPDC003376]